VLRVLPVSAMNLPQLGAVIQKLVAGTFCRSQRVMIASKRVRHWTHRTPSIAVCIAVSVGVGSDGIYDDDDCYVKVKFTLEQATKAHRGE